MRKTNKRALYESIMKNVSKLVKRSLNEEADFEEMSIPSLDTELDGAFAALSKFYRKSPKLKELIYDLVDGLDIIPTSKLERAALEPINHQLFYNPKFFDQIDEEAQACIIAHMALHVKLSEDGYVASEEMTYFEFNLAIDKIINNLLIIVCPSMRTSLKSLSMVY